MGVATVGLALASISAAGAEAKARPRPNLVVRGLAFESSQSHSRSARRPSAVLGGDKKGRFGLEFTVKNLGRARSHNTHVQIFVSAKKFGSELIGPIGPGKSRRVSETYNPTFGGPGLYDTHVCLGEDCTKHIDFAAVPRRWDVKRFSTGPNTPTGIAPFFSAQSTGMDFDFYGTISDNGDPYFLWLASGGVTGDVGGGDGTCTYSGHGAVSHAKWDLTEPEIGYLEISTELNGYFAEIKDDNHAFLSTTACTGYDPFDVENSILPLETIGLDGRVDRSMLPSDRTLSESYNIPTDIGGGYTVGEWSFRADLP